MSAEQATGLPAAELSAAKCALLELRLRGRSHASGIVPRTARDDVPLSFAQERIWFLHRVQQGGTSYNICMARVLQGGVDEAALERALGEVVRRHDVLRTTFREVDGVPAQKIAPFAGFTLPVEDLSGLGEPERGAEVRRQAVEDAALPFDLSAGPLFRTKLLRLGAEEHALLLGMHHIVSDGWSMGVFFREMWTLYQAYRAGRESPLPELAVQYADYAVWQRERPQMDAAARHLAYWKEQFAGAPSLLELPADHPRPPVPSFRGGTVPVNVPAAMLEALRELARGEGATLYMVVLAAFQVMLSKYAGSDDVVVGTLVAGRTRAEVQELIGLFMNTLVLRADLSGARSFREVLQEVREVVLGAYEHQDLPFERLVAELHPERSLSHSSLFQVLFQLDDAGEGTRSVAGIRTRAVEVEHGNSKFDLTLGLGAHSRGIAGTLTYSTDLFERATARRMVAHLERVLEQVAGEPDRPLARLDLMGGAERAQVMGWNRTEAAFPADRCIHELFREQAERVPDAVAVTFGGRALRYRELDERANRLAHHLAGLGVGQEVRVGICLERSLELMVAILGVMKAGGAYVPVDPAHPAERIGYVLEDSDARVLLTQERLRDRLPVREAVQVVAVDREWDRIAASPADPPQVGVGPENLAYVIYTSGSTGRPKGVAMHHRGVCNYLHWGVRAYGADEGEGAPVFSSMAVDLTITNLLPLFAGRPVRFLPEESPVEALAEVLRGRPGFGLIKITPTHLSLLTPLLTPGEARGAARRLVVGADFLSAETTLFWQDHAPGVRLMNEYGPTETVVGCSAYVLPPGLHRAGPVPVGPPIQNLTFHVLDAHLEPVPVGLPGELYIGGAGVARGYLGRPALSAEKFVPDPFAQPGARMYRTGDRARWLPDGNLLILGRVDNQVKVRGYRVELGEIESVLRRYPAVRECLVVVREDRPGDRRLVAYVVGGAEEARLREHLLGSLPEYMVPAAFVPLDSLPQTPTGKIDPRTLPAPEYGRADTESGEPRSEAEVELIRIWEDVLGIQGVGPTQNFFDLGGNSFLALRLFAQVNRRLGHDLPLATLFAGATVRGMAEAMEQRSGSASPVSSRVVPVQPGGSLPPLFGVHPAGRSVAAYLRLARHLGADQPVFGVPDLEDDLSRPVPQIASEHVRSIRSVQPEGPYYLAGWSFGGFVAYEMAVQLERQGQRVAFVGLMDTMSPLLAQCDLSLEHDLDLVLSNAQDVATQTGRSLSIGREELEGLDPDEQVLRVVEALHAQGAAPADYDAAALQESCDIILDRRVSLSRYVPGRFHGTLTLFRATVVNDEHRRFLAEHTTSEEERRTLGWCSISPGRVEVHPVPGRHVTIGTEPHVRVLAQRMSEALVAARERAGSAAPAEPGVPFSGTFA